MPTFSNWHHSPPHCDFGTGSTYIVTGGTFGKIHVFKSASHLELVDHTLRSVVETSGWRLEAWAVLSNHYHLVATATNDAMPLKRLISKIHQISAKRSNEIDGTPGRRVWNQYWETPITYHRSYLARLRYVHFNPVHHGVCRDAVAYRWCSASIFLHSADSGFRKSVLAMPIDAVFVPDDF